MKVEAWIFGALGIFVLLVTPVYWVMSRDPTGTAALILTFFLVLMMYLYLTGRRYDARPEDRKDGEIAEGAGELGFFPPQSKWPLYCALTFCLVMLAPIFGWWLLLLSIGLSCITVTGWLYEFYRGDHAH